MPRLPCQLSVQVLEHLLLSGKPDLTSMALSAQALVAQMLGAAEPELSSVNLSAQEDHGKAPMRSASGAALTCMHAETLNPKPQF